MKKLLVISLVIIFILSGCVSKPAPEPPQVDGSINEFGRILKEVQQERDKALSKVAELEALLLLESKGEFVLQGEWEGEKNTVTDVFEVMTEPFLVSWSNSPQQSGYLSIRVKTRSGKLVREFNSTKHMTSTDYISDTGLFVFDVTAINTYWTAKLFTLQGDAN